MEFTDESCTFKNAKIQDLTETSFDYFNEIRTPRMNSTKMPKFTRLLNTSKL